jgi:hypothetical protein
VVAVILFDNSDYFITLYANRRVLLGALRLRRVRFTVLGSCRLRDGSQNESRHFFVFNDF